MAEFKTTVVIESQITLTITESEARMLEKISQYQALHIGGAIAKVISMREFEPHQKAFVGFVEGIRSSLGDSLKKVDAARKAME